jgi:hypothetical protein
MKFLISSLKKEKGIKNKFKLFWSYYGKFIIILPIILIFIFFLWPEQQKNKPSVLNIAIYTNRVNLTDEGLLENDFNKKLNIDKKKTVNFMLGDAKSPEIISKMYTQIQTGEIDILIVPKAGVDNLSKAGSLKKINAADYLNYAVSAKKISELQDYKNSYITIPISAKHQDMVNKFLAKID